ncbi:MAG: extracellular solute-binding protein, partial [Candidatus Hydrogenedentes bacterium]|nr:extracellular solute-binding protein [Candidatus Hydrogenedentota bacterium]
DSVLPKSLLDDFRAEVVADCTYGGHLIALPADGFCSALWYNTQTIGNTPPATWLHLSAIVNADDTSPVQGPSNGLGAFPFLESLWSAGGDVLADGACTLDRAPAHRALDFVLHVTRGAPRSESAAFTQWAGGRLAMTVASSARLPAAARSGIAFGVAPVPGETGPISRRSDDVVVVFSREQGAGAADIATFLDWLTGPEVMGEHAAEAGSVPLRNSTRTIESRIPGVAAAYAAGRSTPLHADWSAIESELERGIAEAYDAIERDRHTTPPAPK